jgi:hypothetical protein
MRILHLPCESALADPRPAFFPVPVPESAFSSVSVPFNYEDQGRKSGIGPVVVLISLPLALRLRLS